MSLTRRALILATAASGLAPLMPAIAARSRMPLPAGLWQSRTTAELLAFDRRACRTYTRHSGAVVLVDEVPLEEMLREVLDARVDGVLDLEYWGTLTRFRYDRLDGWPDLPRLDEDDDWISDPRMTVDAFFEVLAGHFAFAAERAIDWTELRSECDAALGHRRPSADRLFDAMTSTLRHLRDGHGSLQAMERRSESRSSESLLYRTWRTAGGFSSGVDLSDAFDREWLRHVQRRVLSGRGRLAGSGTVAWGWLPSGLGYIFLMSCEGLAEDEGGFADVMAARQTFGRILRDLGAAKGMVIDLRVNSGGWDRVALALASHFTDRPVLAFTKQPVRLGVGLDTQAIEVTPADGVRYTGPVAVLTSDATASAAEVGALAFRSLPGTKSFGSPTYGALSDPFSYRLPNGWKGTVSNEIYRAADGRVHEGTGIPPDRLTAKPSASDYWETVDAQLREAEAWLLAL
ncbi:S41 family peptidase (plasmid) [Skermanella rosea]|uniref:S41 family peptidase n=1 Tax=Skermanella rosea TaxID=1817965 RepID=UPI0019324482|nr:S41 family peptidase [Skermanella rosea]UEM06787.1 S41 family peptidase [Skermanella rosea]